ncbi:hypothetical protein [Microbacterium sp. MYb64]|uniref:hypothetical protein n=1 Tax=Microbacterium sp. MYb64 TaxID=1848691 RepID=UPI0011B04954|nr:hypothetical protein [Microbacterium sp. MYb64]
MSSFEFDTAALRGPVDRSTPVRPPESAIHGSAAEELSVRRLVISVVIQVLGFGVLAAIMVVFVQLIFGGDGMNALTWIIAAFMVSPFAAIAQIRAFGSRRRELDERTYRLTRFAADNRMSHVAAEPAVEHPVARFRTGGPLAIRDLLRAPERSGLEAGTYYYVRSMGRSTVAHSSSYVALDLRGAAPSMTMATKLGDVWSQPSTRGSTQHQVSINEDFDERVRVYCEPQDDDAVRRQLTPQVRDALLEVAGKCDIEVDGGRIHIIARKALPFTDPVFWRWVGDIDRLVSLFSRPEAPVPAGTASGWRSRSVERDALFAVPRSGRGFAIGALVIVLGLVAAAVITAMS